MTIIALAVAALLHIHLLAIAATARLFGIYVRSIRIGVGPRLLRIGRVEWRLLPLAGSVQLKDARDEVHHLEDPEAAPGKSLDAQPLWIRVAVSLSGCVALVLLAILAHPGSALQSIVNGPAQLFQGAMDYHLGMGLIERVAALPQLGLVAAVGILAARMAALNLLPAPPFNGGQAIIEVVFRGRPLPEWFDKVQRACLVLLLLWWIGWSVSIFNWVVRQ